MGRRRRFLDRNASTTFSLVPTELLSESERNASDGGGIASHAWIRAEGTGRSSHGELEAWEDGDQDGDPGSLPWSLRQEFLSLGLPDDGYDYSIHLRDVGGGARAEARTLLVAPRPPQAKEDTRSIDARKRVSDSEKGSRGGGDREEDDFEARGMRSSALDASTVSMDAATREDFEDVSRALQDANDGLEELQDDFVSLALQDVDLGIQEGHGGASRTERIASIERSHATATAARGPREIDEAFESCLSRLYASDTDEEGGEGQQGVGGSSRVELDGLEPFRLPTSEEIEAKDASDARAAKEATLRWIESSIDEEKDGGRDEEEGYDTGDATNSSEEEDQETRELSEQLRGSCRVDAPPRPKLIVAPTRIRLSQRSGLPSRKPLASDIESSSASTRTSKKVGPVVERRKGETAEEKRARKASVKEAKRSVRERKAEAKLQRKREEQAHPESAVRIVSLP